MLWVLGDRIGCYVRERVACYVTDRMGWNSVCRIERLIVCNVPWCGHGVIGTLRISTELN